MWVESNHLVLFYSAYEAYYLRVMSTNHVMSLALFSMLTIMLSWQVAKGLRTGRLKSGAVIYERGEQPAEFWSNLAFSAIVIAILLWLLAETVLDASDPRAASFLPFALAAFAAFEVIRGIQTGSTGFGRSRFSRGAAPRQYWGLLFAYAAMAVAVAALGLWPLSRDAAEQTTYQKVVSPVVKAVRDELRTQPSLVFRNIRVDGQSRRVCGEVVANGRPRRFFGNAVRGAGAVRLEDESPAFEPAYRRVCGAPGYVPQ